MVQKNTFLLISVLILVLFSLCNAETKDESLHRNPFEKSAYVTPNNNSNNLNIDNTQFSSEIRLYATLTSNDRSLANVDGEMIFVGEKIKGYELISVGEGVATFFKDGKELTLSVSEKHLKLRR